MQDEDTMASSHGECDECNDDIGKSLDLFLQNNIFDKIVLIIRFQVTTKSYPHLIRYPPSGGTGLG